MTLTRRIHLATIALAALTFSIGITEPARATSARSTLAPTGADPNASGRAVMRAKRKKGALQGQLLVTARKVDASAEFEVTIDGVRVGTLTANRRGSARARFRTTPRGADQLLGVDPRGRALAILRSGAVVLAGVLPDDASTTGDAAHDVPSTRTPPSLAHCAAVRSSHSGPESSGRQHTGARRAATRRPRSATRSSSTSTAIPATSRPARRRSRPDSSQECRRQ